MTFPFHVCVCVCVFVCVCVYVCVCACVCVLVISLAHHLAILGAFPELRIAAVKFVMSVRPSVCPSARYNLAPAGRILLKLHNR